MHKVWVTKYALTDGILEYEIPGPAACGAKMVTIEHKGSTFYFHDKDWHWTREDAVARAEVMRVNKIKSLKKSLAKFESWKFT